MLKNTVIIALIILALYLYYQKRKLKGLPATDTSSRTIYEVGEDHEDLIAEKDAAIRSKNEAEAEVLSLTNRLKNKQSEVSRKEQEIERLNQEKSQSEIALNSKLKEWKDKYSKQGKQLDEEQLENNKLEEKIEQLESQIIELTRSKSPMPGEFPPENVTETAEVPWEETTETTETASNWESVTDEPVEEVEEANPKKKKT